ncbi:MAG: glycoside hydrolase [Spirochaetales bacterium]|nr:glycoside hydrolase [Spirochaetales bacterium]
MSLVKIKSGAFLMGNDRRLPDELLTPSCFRYGDFDERPVHRVSISYDYYMGQCQVTNDLYEQFDPSHRELRGKLGFSRDDDEAAVFVSWRDAADFCVWLSEREGTTFRLPTEAEWEYACKAGTISAFHTGDELPPAFLKNARQTWFPDSARSTGENVVQLHVGKTSPNPCGLCDMHGNVEEWCHDWYGPYQERDQSDPAGPGAGDFRVTRGGSHSTESYYLRSANRSGALPDERSWLIGFRVVQGPLPFGQRSVGRPRVELHRSNVGQRSKPMAVSGTTAPFFAGPARYVKIPPSSYGPMFSRHNHDPAICQCPNDDLLAIWYSCVTEPGRELAILASRLRTGCTEWDEASVFWDAPDRNDHAPALFCDGNRIFHFNGLSAAATWGPLQTILRTSDDSGSTWSEARIIIEDHGPRHMPIASVFSLDDGTIVLPCDAVTVGSGGTALWLSNDGGNTWNDAGGTIAGIHASAAELGDGRLLAFGRGDEINGSMAMSISADRGKSWTYSASPFPPIRGGQRLILKRLKGVCEEGSDPLLFISFANEPLESENAYPIIDMKGERRPVSGMYSALSFDDGATWPFGRLISDDEPTRTIEALDGMPCTMGPNTAEINGYLTACQSADGMVQLISSTNHYVFNLEWLIGRPPGFTDV